jgi:hypothetical protein
MKEEIGRKAESVDEIADKLLMKNSREVLENVSR